MPPQSSGAFWLSSVSLWGLKENVTVIHLLQLEILMTSDSHSRLGKVEL